MRGRGLITGLAVLAGVIAAGHALRTSLGLEPSIESLRGTVEALGWRGPVLFFALVVFRQALALPAALVLPVGGLCFGAGFGTVLGALGIVVSGVMKFSIARWIGRDWMRQRLGERFRRFERRIERMGPAVIGVSTAHPFGILSPFHWAAGLTSLPLAPFVAALVLGAPVRAFAFSAFGATLTNTGSPEFRWALLGLTLAIVVPLAVPALRRRLLPGE